MALREKATNHYYKINFDLCAVRGLKVFVSFSVYNSTEEREKEKERQGKWAGFFQKLRENLQSQYDALIKAIDTKGLTPEQVLSQTEEGMIDSTKYAELWTMQNNLLSLEPFEQEIGDRLFKYRDDAKNTLIIPDEIKKELETLGFEQQWIDSPVLLDGGGEVYTGDYDGEPITYEFFYERLKSVMGETEDC